jgi:aspartyl-tRNA(Asn)/glutamyl-tRNA(Gln) amidotransferase subunit A
VKAVAATEDALQLAHAWQPLLNCFVSIDDTDALTRAAQVDAGAPATADPRLVGLPVAYKDVFVRPGRQPGAGSAVTLPAATQPAAVDIALREAGTVVIGSLHLDEFSYAVTGRNEILGDCRNPWNVSRAPGGSSSGAAAAVAARIVPLAVGTDTGGSVRIPAAWCGVLGFKPTYSAISTAGMVPLAPSHDTVGLLALDVDVLAAGYRALTARAARPDRSAPADPARPLAGLTVGRLTDIGQVVDAEVSGAMDVATDVFVQLGAVVDEASMPDLDHCNAAAAVITASEAAALHAATLEEQPARYQAGTRTRLLVGQLLPAVDYVDALRFRARAMRRVVDGPFSRLDVLITPVTPTVAPELATLPPPSSPQIAADTGSLLQFTRPFNFLGFPSLSVPVGFTAGGLPVAVQLTAAPWHDELLLDVARALQDAIRWADRRPVLPANGPRHVVAPVTAEKG